jgi:hypothetical protein
LEFACEPCAVSYYNSLAEQVACTACPDGYATETEGSTNLSDCKRNEILLMLEKFEIISF